MEWQRYLGDWLPYGLGFLFAVFAGDIAVRTALGPLYGAEDGRRLPAQAIGFLERVIYASATLLDLLSVTGVWLALKVAGSWRHLEVKAEAGADPRRGRDHFNNYLTGNAISLLYGVVGGQSVVWWQAGRIGHALTIPVALVIATVCFVAWLKFRRDAESRASRGRG